MFVTIRRRSRLAVDRGYASVAVKNGAPVYTSQCARTMCLRSYPVAASRCLSSTAQFENIDCYEATRRVRAAKWACRRRLDPSANSAATQYRTQIQADAIASSFAV